MKVSKKKASGVMAHLMSNIDPNSMVKTRNKMLQEAKTAENSKKLYSGKVIYQPSGKAGEYAQWACNFYTGCSNNCDYCYLKKGPYAHVWTDYPKLKSSFKNEDEAFQCFVKEVNKNLDALRHHGLFFSFSTDPMLEETAALTIASMEYCVKHGIPCVVLSKCARMAECLDNPAFNSERGRELLVFGSTLTASDMEEGNASSHLERINTLAAFHSAGFQTFASIEPIVSFAASLKAVKDAAPYCSVLKIGLMSGVKKDYYDLNECLDFIKQVSVVATLNRCRLYWKNSVRKFILERYQGDDASKVMLERAVSNL
jgi:DNA repair photolyase